MKGNNESLCEMKRRQVRLKRDWTPDHVIKRRDRYSLNKKLSTYQKLKKNIFRQGNKRKDQIESFSIQYFSSEYWRRLKACYV